MLHRELEMGNFHRETLKTRGENTHHPPNKPKTLGPRKKHPHCFPERTHGLGPRSFQAILWGTRGEQVPATGRGPGGVCARPRQFSKGLGVQVQAARPGIELQGTEEHLPADREGPDPRRVRGDRRGRRGSATKAPRAALGHVSCGARPGSVLSGPLLSAPRAAQAGPGAGTPSLRPSPPSRCLPQPRQVRGCLPR